MTVPIRGAAQRLRDAALLSATVLATGLLAPAEAAQFKVVVNPVADPTMAGLALPDGAPVTGVFSGVQGWPMNAITLSLLPSGKILSFGTPAGNPGTQDGRTFDSWDPTQGFGAGHITLAGVGGINSFCAAQAFRPDGSLMIAGGIFDNGNDKGSLTLNGTATAVTAVAAKLANDRYYSTMLTLPNGRQLIMGGSYPYQGGWADPQGSIDKGYMTGMTPELFDGTRWTSLFGAKSRDAFGPDNNRWWYPRAWVAPNGKVFGITSEKMWFLDPSGNGAVTVTTFKEPQRDAASALDAPNVGPVSTAAMFDTGRILQVGGNSYDNGNGFLSSSRATVIDINGGNPVVTDTAPMSVGRAWANATVLPTGQIAVTGGSKWNDRADGDTVLQSEIWDPRTGTWTAGASGGVYRGYHSSAILMQNGAVLLAGGGAPGPVANQNVEVFYPPYLFTTVDGKTALAPRPQIVSLSTAQLQHGQAMQFELTSQNGLAQVVLVGLSATTHSFNSTQRRIPAAFTQAGTAVTLQPPASANVAPPGYYQLVAIDQKGVPSPGVIVALGAGVAAPSQVAAPAVAATGTGTGSQAGGGGSGTGGGTGGGGTGAGGGTGTSVASGAAVSLQASNYTTSYLTNVGGTARLMTPATASDRQQATFRQVPGLAGQGVSFQSSTAAGQYLRHQNFQIYQQANDGGDIFKRGATFTPRAGLAGTCGCTTGTCTSYESIDWPGYYLRHQNFNFYIAQPDGGDLFKQDASFCPAPPADGSAASTPVSLQASNYTTSYLTNVGGTARLMTPATASDRQQATFRQVPGLAGQGVSFQSSTAAGQYLRHQNFQIYQQASDGGDIFKRGATFTPRAGLAGTCGCTTGTCTSYESIDWPGYYLRHQNFNFYIAQPDGGDLFKQDASFCPAPALQ
ncbi:AbfB domain-containing protein [Methylobacterium indicum]|uniref:AbfB domain-containing protein n=1 Tax=Methylobacterium indicum TaxID=1775910 RepID=UPI00069DD13D|nr:AbfB domain-containing protein [Methylobacterium indicum]